MRVRLLNIAANVALVASVAALGGAVWIRYGHDRLFPPMEEGQSAFRVGAKAPAIAGVDYRRQDRTLVLFLSVSCHYCQESIPFYNSLDGMARTASGKLKVFPVFPEDVADIERFRLQSKLIPEAIGGQNIFGEGVRATPTVVLVSRDGSVVGSWAGSSAPIKDHIMSAVRQSL